MHDASVALQGDLGAGKTSFVRHLLRALGVTGRIRSPSYAIVETYDAHGLSIRHFDFYRFDDPREWEDAGLRDLYAAAGLNLVEWPERAAGVLPPPDLWLRLVVRDDDARAVHVRAGTVTGAALRTALLGDPAGVLC